MVRWTKGQLAVKKGHHVFTDRQISGRLAGVLQAQGPVDNLFCAGERAGAMVGHTEAVVTGSLAGRNAVLKACGKPLYVYPNELAVGDFVNHTTDDMKKEECRGTKYTFSGSVYFERMKQLGLYTSDLQEIKARAAKLGAAGILSQKVC